MEYATWGRGDRSLLFIPGGPASSIPTGLFAWWVQRLFTPYVDAGYTVWYVTRRRGMPLGHTMADIADDHAEFIRDELGGSVDVVVGESLGGLIAQHLAGRHPDTLRRLVLVVSAWGVNEATKGTDGRLAGALARGHTRAAGTAFAEYLVSGARMAWLRRLLAPGIERGFLSGEGVPVQDVLVEADAERTCDTRADLLRVAAPALLIAGDRDKFFPVSLIEETARLLPDARIVWYRGRGHMRVAMSPKVTQDVLVFAP